MKTVNLEEILHKHNEIEACLEHSYNIYTHAMREACEQVIDQAADIVQSARAGEIDQDFRSIIFRINQLKKQII